MRRAIWVVLGGILVLTVFAGVFFIIRDKPAESKPAAVSSPKTAPGKLESTKAAMKKTYTGAPSPLPAAQIKGKSATISTEKGVIVFSFFEDAPLAASNFIFLAGEGFYDGLTFHRREEGFVIQGGDPNGTGTGGPGYQFADEPVTRDYKRGIVAMANAGPDTNGSQFFIVLADTPLPKSYTIFGEVTKGMDVVDAIKVGDVMTSVNIE